MLWCFIPDILTKIFSCLLVRPLEPERPHNQPSLPVVKTEPATASTTIMVTIPGNPIPVFCRPILGKRHREIEDKENAAEAKRHYVTNEGIEVTIWRSPSGVCAD